MRVTKTNLALAGLATLFVSQVAVFSFRAQSEPIPAPGLVGTSVAEVSVETPAGLAFSSTCAHCTRVALDWALWLSSHRDVGVRILAASKEPLDDAEAYATLHGWDVETVRIDLGLGSLGHQLVARTPWIFLLDEAGVIRFERHCTQLAALDSLLNQGGQ